MKYYCNGNKLFEGKYLNWKRKGKGIEYNYFIYELFEGIFKCFKIEWYKI